MFHSPPDRPLMPISTYQISIITPRADAKMQSMCISVRSRTRGTRALYMYVYNPKRKVPTSGRSASARRGAPGVNDPDFCASPKTYEFLRHRLMRASPTPRRSFLLPLLPYAPRVIYVCTYSENS